MRNFPKNPYDSSSLHLVESPQSYICTCSCNVMEHVHSLHNIYHVSTSRCNPCFLFAFYAVEYDVDSVDPLFFHFMLLSLRLLFLLLLFFAVTVVDVLLPDEVLVDDALLDVHLEV